MATKQNPPVASLKATNGLCSIRYTDYSKLILPLPEEWWLDAQTPQVDISLTTVMDFIVHKVQQGSIITVLILAKGNFHLLKTLGSDARPGLVDDLGDLVPQFQQACLSAGHGLGMVKLDRKSVV